MVHGNKGSKSSVELDLASTYADSNSSENKEEHGSTSILSSFITNEYIDIKLKQLLEDNGPSRTVTLKHGGTAPG